MVWDSGLISFIFFFSFTSGNAVFPVSFIEEIILSSLYVLYSFDISYLPMYVQVILGLSILFHWSMYLFFCQYHAILITMTLSYSLKSMLYFQLCPFFGGSYFYLGIFLLWFYIYFRNLCSTLWKMSLGFERNFIEYVGCFS